MMKTTAVQQSTPPQSKPAGATFMTAALTMSWQLALVVLVPVIGGVQLDKALSTSPVCTLIGIALALVGSGGVMWYTVRVVGRLPVPKLTAAQRKAVQKSYEEDDE